MEGENRLGTLKKTAEKAWQNLNNTQKITLGVAAAFVVISLLFIIFTKREPAYITLLNDASSNNGTKIIKQLKEAKIPCKVSPDGRSIQVDKNQINKARLELAGKGYLQNTEVGFELFDQKNNLGSSDFDSRINYMRALQGEIARSISSIDGVEKARVHLGMPTPDIFAEEIKKPGASICLTLKPGFQISQENVHSIVQLVVNSVPDLTADNISIISSAGEVLWEQNKGKDASASVFNNRLLKIQNEYQETIEHNIQSMLDEIIGKGKSVVRVYADLDLSSSEINEETYIPIEGTNGGIRSQQVVEEYYNKKNDETATPMSLSTDEPISETGSPLYKRKNQTTNYEISKRTSHIVKPPAQVRHLFVAVTVDQEAFKCVNEDDFRQVVSAAGGIDPERGDRLSIMPAIFYNSDSQTISSKPAVPVPNTNYNIASLLPPVFTGITGIILLSMLFMYYKPAKKKKPEKPRESEKTGLSASKEKDTSWIVFRLSSLPEHKLMEIVQNTNPRIGTLILSLLPKDKASNIIGNLPPEQIKLLHARLQRKSKPDPRILIRLMESLEEHFSFDAPGDLQTNIEEIKWEKSTVMSS